ncbi:FAD-dependent oxidoreductase, partial [Staphylococcus epidermidis]|uniref:FAD-dependent oxidoreductase n=1 Tax=Staphylococcus epidermidis TaxID=1282 RepID=UPI0037D9A8B1
MQPQPPISKNLKLHVNNQTYQPKHIILPTPTHPFIPPIDGLHQLNYQTTHTFFHLHNLPKHLPLIPPPLIPTQLPSSIPHLQLRVTIIQLADHILLTQINQTTQILKPHLHNQPINILTKPNIKQVKQ